MEKRKSAVKWLWLRTLFAAAVMMLMLAGCSGTAADSDGTSSADTADGTDILDEIADAGEAAIVYDYILGDADGNELVNLAVGDGVIVTADSAESEELPASMAADGDQESDTSRWSSVNEQGNPEHWICLEFPEETKVAFVRLYWERLNVEGFVIETSLDGVTWEVCYTRTQAPTTNEDAFALDEAVTCRYLRLRTTAVSESEENLFLYYQNVSLYEIEVYAGIPMTYALDAPIVENAADGSRYLRLPDVPEGYEIALAGADYEEVIGMDGTVYPTLEEKTLEVGFLITRLSDGACEETPGYEVTVAAAPEYILEAVGGSTEMVSANAAPSLAVGPAEWYGLTGTLTLTDSTEISLIRAGEEYGLGEEGYILAILENEIILMAQEEQGFIWGQATLSELQEANTTLSCGIIRDYPKYAVRGFSIDIGRRMVSIDLLYQIIDELAAYKMNTLSIHLNDNEVLTSSGLDESVEAALTAYSGFRLESSIVNEEGESLTSSDGYLTVEEWKELVQYGAARGVEVVPEIDMPAHSLSITSLFPDLGLDGSPDIVDELDLANTDAVELALEIWEEYLTGEDAAFEENETVHIGMDEYYGDAEDYLTFLNTIVELVQDTGRTVRMWGSLGMMTDAESEAPAASESGTESAASVDVLSQTGSADRADIQVQIWSWVWADPEETYDAGYSVINSMSNTLYIVPGGGYDYLDLDALSDWEPNRFTSDYVTIELPSWSPRMTGAIYCMWNDNFDLDLTEDDLYERFAQPLALLGSRLW